MSAKQKIQEALKSISNLAAEKEETMNQKPWFEKLGEDAPGQSKHQRGRTKPQGHRRALRDARKRQKLARRAQRGRR